MNNTLRKGLSLLELLSHSERPLTLTQIATQLGIVKSNVHRLMQALSEQGYVLRHEDTGAYTASIKLWELGSAVLAKLDLRRHAERQMDALLERTGESVHLSVLDRGEAVYVHKLESSNPITDPAQFLREMRRIRDQGYAVNRGEWREAVWGVAAPIMDARGSVIAAVGISGPAERLRKRDLKECAHLLVLAAMDIARGLGSNPEFGTLSRLGGRRR